jgi:hypothetical protein
MQSVRAVSRASGPVQDRSLRGAERQVFVSRPAVERLPADTLPAWFG